MNLSFIILNILILMSLSGCVTFSQMENGLTSLQGKRINEAFNVLGYPIGKQQFGSDNVYYWSTSRSGAMTISQPVTTTGYYGSTPYSGTTYYNQIVPVNYNCEIKLITTVEDVIRTWEYNGNIGGCQNWIIQLNNYRKSIQKE